MGRRFWAWPGAALCLAAFAVPLRAAEPPAPPTPGLVGVWVYRDAQSLTQIEFRADGRYSRLFQSAQGRLAEAGTYGLQGEVLELRPDGAGGAIQLRVRLLDANTLEVANAAGGGARLTRQAAAPPVAPPGVPAPEGRGARPTSYRLFRCLDERGLKDEYGRPLEVFRLLVPDGWRAAGGIRWVWLEKDPRTLGELELLSPAILSFAAGTPDGRVGLEFYPSILLVDISASPAARMGLFPPGSNYMGGTVSPVIGPADYIQRLVIPHQRRLANARVVSQQPLPALAQLLGREDQLYAGALQSVGAAMQHAAAEVTVDYEQGGLAVVEPLPRRVGVCGGFQRWRCTWFWDARLEFRID